MKYHKLIIICSCILFGCNGNNEIVDEPGLDEDPALPNILLIIADDMGKDATNGFSEGDDKPNTPHLDGIRSGGITFNNFWTYPTCSPTRASIITGKYGYNTGVKWASDAMSTSETILHRHITQQTENTYATALIGKWHLYGNRSNENPEEQGMDYFAGIMNGSVSDYYDWSLIEDGQATNQTDYITQKFTDLAMNWVSEQNKPWFLWLAYTAPHTPIHTPPAEMHSYGDLPQYSQGMDALPYYLATIEAMDYQIGRFLDHLSEDERANTMIIFLGDNGTPNQASQSPYSSTTVKGTLYQGGINTPLYVSGPGITRIGEEDDNLITSTDLFATIGEIVGASDSEINDSKSFKSLFTASSTHRDFQYSEMDDGNSDSWAISNGQYKLIVDANGNEELYELISDPYERINLLSGVLDDNQEDAKTQLEHALTEIRN